MRRVALLVLITASLAGCAARSTATPPACFHAEESIETAIGYCEAVRTGNLLYVSGSVGKGEMSVAMRQAYDAIQRTLQAHGLGFRNVVHETVYTTDLDAFIRNKEVRRQYFGAELPSATWVQVQRLYSAAAVVEVEVTAAFPPR